jgi:hypothetical protein
MGLGFRNMDEESKQYIRDIVKINASIILYLVMLLLVLVYYEPGISPF